LGTAGLAWERTTMEGMTERTYIAIDLKSFYASLECAERFLDPLHTNLVVADASRTEKTICLAVSPSLKAYGIPGRPRLFEVVQKVKEINEERLKRTPFHQFSGSSHDERELKASSFLALDYLIAPPQMSHYIACSANIYKIYLKYIAPEDIHVYSIDEVFIDATNYLGTYHITAKELSMRMITEVLKETGITATAGIGTNLYLAKIAMDIVAKHIPPDRNGVRIAELDEMSYRKTLWNHQPLTDFWRVGNGYATKLESHGMRTMGDIARTSLKSEETLYKLFGVNAEFLIDHAWGWEPCTIADIKAYKPQSNCFGSGQVLSCAYPRDKARLVVREMTEQLVLDLVEKELVTNQLVLTIGYDIENMKGNHYSGETTTDRYGRRIPKHSQGTANLPCFSSSTKMITEAVMALFDRIAGKDLLVRRLNIAASHVGKRDSCSATEQLDLFSSKEATEMKEDREKEENMQKTLLGIKKKFGKNAILKGMDFEDGATAILRNSQIGGHKA
jgi:DNA polymerase V